jgi:hypothetical protein
MSIADRRELLIALTSVTLISDLVQHRAKAVRNCDPAQRP